ncbi:MAG: hypothetical protein KDA57_20520 [Planctomycetales bacterium]|nr:hypothetical protein [Planctomycetales bacterium]
MKSVFAMAATLCVLEGCTLASAQSCAEFKREMFALQRPSAAAIEVTNCRRARNEYVVSVRLISDAGSTEAQQISAEGEALVLFVDTSLDINNDGVPDLGIATGKGRSGDGMHYWLLGKNLLSLIDVGEAPMLKRSLVGRRPLWALVPGSGEVQATRIEYDLSLGALLQTKAIQFIPQLDSSYRVSVWVRSGTGSGGWLVEKPTLFLSEADARECMEGGKCPE